MRNRPSRQFLQHEGNVDDKVTETRRLRRPRPGRRRKEVAIFGGGIAGLTAAHELIERGYRVEVFEKEAASPIDVLLSRECTVGGKAQTQWSCVARPDENRRAGRRMLSTRPIKTEFFRLRLRFGSSVEIPKAQMHVVEKAVSILIDDARVRECEVRGWCHNRHDAPYPNFPAEYEPEEIAALKKEGLSDESLSAEERFIAAREDYQRALAVAKAVVKELRSRKKGRKCKLVMYRPDRRPRPTPDDTTLRIYPVPMGLGLRDDWTVDDARRNYVDFHIIEDWIPGEHGFRFFPSFYRNLGDTMRRTPIASEGNLYVETAGTVRDNIRPTRNQYMAMNASEKTYAFSRRPISSTEKKFEQMLTMMTSHGYNLDDMTRGQAMVFKYMTSCPERRAAECENISWWDFVGGETFSAAFQKYFDDTGQTLLAMRTRDCDARTYGNITIQMLLDHVAPEDGQEDRKTDGTLNGPTSVAWFDHWRRYLERQGVEFHRGELLELKDENGEIWPVVRLGEPSNRTPTIVLRDYYVVATGDIAAKRLCTETNPSRAAGAPRTRPKFAGDDFQRLHDWELGSARRAQPKGAHQHMSGIQYYFESDIPFVDGHIDYADAEWGLSSISQPQFWTRHRGWWSGYRGVLSVDICNWFKPSERLERPAWECSPREIAEEIWHQIKKTVPADLRDKIPEPILYHLDRNIRFAEDRNGRYRASHNRTPFLTNRVGDYPRRPGKPGKYAVHRDSLVFAGDFMQTYTRMTTMEAANESARHAVNAILAHDEDFHGARCTTWNPEDHEPSDLKPLIDLDRRLFAMGLPHSSEIGDFSPASLRGRRRYGV